MKNRKTVSLVANIISFAVSIGINFVLSPYIVKHLGTEAVGYVPLINNLVDIVNVIVVAINSMAGRFIAIAIHKNNVEEANRYASAVFYSNLIMAGFITVAAGITYLNINNIFNISDVMLSDVKTAFIFITINYIIHIVFSVFSVAPFVANRVDITAKVNIIYLAIRATCIFIFFACFKPHIWYISAATILATTVKSVIDARFSKILIPDIAIKTAHFSFTHVKELLSSGVWNSVNKLGYKLLGSLDVILANIYINAYSMGCISISKTIPNTVSTLITTVVAVFLPSVVKLYAKNDIASLKKEVQTGNSVVCLILAPILSFIMMFGKDFFSLWMPSEDSMLLQELSILAIMPLYLTISCKTMPNIFQTTNKLRLPTLITLSSSTICLLTVLILLKFTDAGVYAIAGTSSVFIVLREIVFEPIYAAKCIGERWHFFYPQIIRGVVSSIASCAIAYIVRVIFVPRTWLTLIIVGVIVAVVSFVITFAIALNKGEKREALALGKVLFNRLLHVKS